MRRSGALSLDSMAASFYSSPLIGATTTLACFAHEIPHEIADYSILVRSGFTKKQAMQSQFLTAVGAFVSSCAFILVFVRIDVTNVLTEKKCLSGWVSYRLLSVARSHV